MAQRAGAGRPRIGKYPWPAMSPSTGKMVVAALQKSMSLNRPFIVRSKGPVGGSRPASPRGAPPPGRPCEQCSGNSSLAVVPAQLAPWLSRGGGARSAGALVFSAMGLDTRGGWGGVSRRLAGSGGGARGGAWTLGLQDKQLTAWIKQRTDAKGTHDLLWLMEERGHSLNAFHLAAVWGELAKMTSRGGKDVEKTLFQGLNRWTIAKLPEMGARGVADVVYSMARLRDSGRRGLYPKP